MGGIEMRVQIRDDNQNWLNWGNLVQAWIDNVEARPSTVGKLRQQMAERGIDATVPGTDDRAVQIVSYANSYNDALVIVIPSAPMRDDKIATVAPGPYSNMPLFYDIAYAGAPRANLSAEQAHDFALRRIGEYTVNECC
jgi:hypothetical protein